MKIKKLAALLIIAISLAGLAACSMSEEPKIKRQPISFNTDLHQVSMELPSSWTVDSEALTIIKEEARFSFDADYSTDEIQNPKVEHSNVMTDSGKELIVTVTTDKDDSSQDALVYVEDASAVTKNPNFHFLFEAPIDYLDAEFWDIIKTISWELL